MDAPVFAVVGCVNMGKSSLVATLTEQDWVPIDRRPGTTQRADAYDLLVDGQVVLTLVDTPGFQNARRALDWIERHLAEGGDDQRTPPQAVRAFVAEHQGQAVFVNEVRLLQPVLDGAGIIYVVHGGKPYQQRYEAEMRLLAMTGAPRMGVINLVDGGTPEPAWQEALSPWFKVATFDTHQAGPEQRLALLRSFAGVDDAWAPAVQVAVEQLTADWQRRQGTVATIISDCLVDILTACEEGPADGDRQATRRKLAAALGKRLRQREQQARRAVEERYRHQRLERVEAELPVLDEDLLDRRAWRLLGLSRRQIFGAGAAAGAAVGGAVDAGVGGVSFLAGTLVGAAIGGTASLMGAWSAADARVLGQRVGGDLLQVVPPDDVQFPFVLLDRAVLHWRAVRVRAHARRDALRLPAAAEAGVVRHLPPGLRKELAAVFARLRAAAGRGIDDDDRRRLQQAIEQVLAHPLIADPREPAHGN